MFHSYGIAFFFLGFLCVSRLSRVISVAYLLKWLFFFLFLFSRFNYSCFSVCPSSNILINLSLLFFTHNISRKTFVIFRARAGGGYFWPILRISSLFYNAEYLSMKYNIAMLHFFSNLHTSSLYGICRPSHQPDEYGTRPFLRWVRTQGRIPDTPNIPKNAAGPSAFP